MCIRANANGWPGSAGQEGWGCVVTCARVRDQVLSASSGQTCPQTQAQEGPTRRQPAMAVDHLPSDEDGGHSARLVPLIAPGMHRPFADVGRAADRNRYVIRARYE